jgi:hypothetical protein
MLWGWTKELQLKQEELRIEYSLKGNYEQTACGVAVGNNHVKVLAKL